MIKSLILRLRRHLDKQVFGKLPRRTTRCPAWFVLREDMRHRDFDALRSIGYTNGDAVVVMLRSDFERVSKLASKNLERASIISTVMLTLPAFRPEIPRPNELKLQYPDA